MKRILILVITAAMLFSCLLPLNVSAKGQEASKKIDTYQKGEQTVIFSEDLNLTEAQKDEILASITGAPASKSVVAKASAVSTMSVAASGTSFNIICALFGHNFSGGYIFVITHRVSPKNPRCLESLYYVEVCSRCGYVESTLLTEYSITCCP